VSIYDEAKAIALAGVGLHFQDISLKLELRGQDGAFEATMPDGRKLRPTRVPKGLQSKTK